MKYDKADLGKNKFKFTVSVDQKTLAECHNKAVKSLGKNTAVAGFRKGHVPLEVLAKHINPAELANVEINEAINVSVSEILDKEDVQLLDQPKVEVKKYVPAQMMEFTLEVETVPPVTLGDATKLKVKKPTVKVEDKQVDDVVNRLRVSSAKKTPTDEAAENGDEVIIDFTGLKDGKEFAGGKATDYPLELGSGQFIPGFEDGIIGHKAGDKFDVNVTFPKEYGAKDLAGMKAVFQIVLKKVNKLTLPELDDKFAASVAPDFKTMDDLRADIRKELTKEAEASANNDYRNELLDKLAEKSKVEVPKVLVDDQLEAANKQFEQNLMYRGLTLDNYLAQAGKTKEEHEKEMRETAHNRIRNSLVLRQFVKDNNIVVTDDDVIAEQAKVLARYHNPQMKENFQTPEAKRQMCEQLLTERAFDKLAELNEK